MHSFINEILIAPLSYVRRCARHRGYSMEPSTDGQSPRGVSSLSKCPIMAAFPATCYSEHVFLVKSHSHFPHQPVQTFLTFLKSLTTCSPCSLAGRTWQSMPQRILGIQSLGTCLYLCPPSLPLSLPQRKRWGAGVGVGWAGSDFLLAKLNLDLM